MLTISFEGLEPLVNKIYEMHKSLEGLRENVPHELRAWQKEDLHRKRPSAKTRRSGRSLKTSTIIRPRSLKSQTYRAAHRAVRRAMRERVRRLRSSRPILRPELFELLRRRMAELLFNITWK
jgi:hypothetical protein